MKKLTIITHFGCARFSIALKCFFMKARVSPRSAASLDCHDRATAAKPSYDLEGKLIITVK
jgi:hypothetical protein